MLKYQVRSGTLTRPKHRSGLIDDDGQSASSNGTSILRNHHRILRNHAAYVSLCHFSVSVKCVILFLESIVVTVVEQQRQFSTAWEEQLGVVAELGRQLERDVRGMGES